MDEFLDTWKDLTTGKRVELHVVEPYVEDYPGQPSLHAIVETNPGKNAGHVPVLVEVKDQGSQREKWKACWVKNPVTFEELAQLDVPKSKAAADLDHVKITVFDIDLQQGQMIRVNQGDLVKFVVPQELQGMGRWTCNR